MLFIVGLGNPGPEYRLNRHNVGFMAVDAIHRRHGFGPWRRRFQAEISEGTLAGEKALLVKPQTFMNESGRAVQQAMQFYKVAPRDIVVIHDEVDLAPGKTRVKAGGGAAGHNGLRSIDAAIGNGYRRLRVGIGHPGVKDAVPHYVLHDFPKADGPWINPLLDAIAENAPLFAAGKDNTVANRLHAASEPEKKPKGDKTLQAPAESESEPAAKPEAKAEKVEAKTEGPLARNLKKLFGL